MFAFLYADLHRIYNAHGSIELNYRVVSWLPPTALLSIKWIRPSDPNGNVLSAFMFIWNCLSSQEHTVLLKFLPR